MICERCKKEQSFYGEKYCRECKNKVISEMKEKGYLQSFPYTGRQRDNNCKEDINETKKGIDR